MSTLRGMIQAKDGHNLFWDLTSLPNKVVWTLPSGIRKQNLSGRISLRTVSAIIAQFNSEHFYKQGLLF